MELLDSEIQTYKGTLSSTKKRRIEEFIVLIMELIKIGYKLKWL
jgi:hypothetical protein